MVKELTTEEKYIIGESQELSIGESEGWTFRFFKIFPALKNRNYQLYFVGQLVSLIGTWLQIVAQGWLVLQLTNSAFLIGLVAAISASPTIIFSLFGGVVIDRFSKKKILFFTQFFSMILALVLGILTVFHIVTVMEIMILAFILGIVNAIDIPARQAYAVELVDRKDLPSAIALNAGIFNGARVIGPGIAGFLIALIGAGGAFIVNGLSFGAIMIVLIFIHTKAVLPKEHPHPLKAIKEGISYSFSHETVRTLLVFAAVLSIFGWSFMTIMPVIAKNTFHMDATGLGYLYAASGIGALIAAVIVSAFGNRMSPVLSIIGGNVLFAVTIFIFTLTRDLPVALFFLLLSGIGLFLEFSMMNTVIQHLIEDEYRGRVMSIYTIMFLGLSPLGNLEIGFFSEHFGTDFAIRLGASVIFLFGFLVFLSRKKILRHIQ